MITGHGIQATGGSPSATGSSRKKCVGLWSWRDLGPAARWVGSPSSTGSWPGIPRPTSSDGRRDLDSPPSCTATDNLCGRQKHGNKATPPTISDHKAGRSEPSPCRLDPLEERLTLPGPAAHPDPASGPAWVATDPWGRGGEQGLPATPGLRPAAAGRPSLDGSPQLQAENGSWVHSRHGYRQRLGVNDRKTFTKLDLKETKATPVIKYMSPITLSGLTQRQWLGGRAKAGCWGKVILGHSFGAQISTIL